MERTMITQANDMYAKVKDNIGQTKEKDKELGFDIDDIESIKNFKLGWTGVGNIYLVKEINEEAKYGSIILPQGTAIEMRKAVVVGIGLMANKVIEIGDIVSTKDMEKDKTGVPMPYPKFPDIKLRGVTFVIYPADLIAGLFVEVEVVAEREKKLWQEIERQRRLVQ